MKKLACAGILIFLIALPVISDDMPVPRRHDLPGSEFSREDIYIGGALWGMINGGADLYYEYGFDRVALQEINWQGEQFRLELYRMTSPLAAWGIYSVSRHGCLSGDIVVKGDCRNRYQYQFSAGDYYLSLINYSGSDKAGELSIEIARIVAKEIEPEDHPIPSFFRRDYFDGMADDIIVLKGITGLQNTLPSLAGAFRSLDNYRVYYLEIQVNGAEAGVVLIETDDPFDNGDIKDLVPLLEVPGALSFRLSKNQQLVLIPLSGEQLHRDFLRLIPDDAY